MENSHKLATQNALEVLKFWHMVEFFVPFDLEEAYSSNNKYELTEEQLVTEQDNSKLPWLSNSALMLAGGNNLYEYRYHIYLLPFDKSEISKLSNRIFPTQWDNVQQTEFAEKYEYIGKTCFAKISLDTKGQPDFERMSLSTLPWALGLLSQKQLSLLHYKHYEDKKTLLQQDLSVFKNLLKEPLPGVLTAPALKVLLTIFKNWAGFSPDYPTALVIEIIKDGLKKEAKTFLEDLSQPAETKSLIELNNQSDILNSFFIEDIEKVINDLNSHQHDNLCSYINGIDKKQKIDLYANENQSIILNKLQPEYLNHGRWPAKNSNFMSLMQQLAINECFHPTNAYSLFSVNGPPGTGKTTLLQDIIAENIVQRARVLSGFNSASEAFNGKITITFSDHKPLNISLLNEKLTGFEMLVASSNNAAVENISKELPLQQKLPLEYQSQCSYLTPVAAKLSANHHPKNTLHLSLTEEQQPWGLISVALGNAKNRNQFRERIFFKAEDDDKKTKLRIQQGKYLSIWEWRDQYQGPSFEQAKQSFNQSNQALGSYLDSIKELVALHNQISSIDDRILNNNEAELTEKIAELEHILKKTAYDKQQIVANLNLLKQSKPNFFEILLRAPAAKIYEKQKKLLLDDLSKLFNQERELKKNAQKCLDQQQNIKLEKQKYDILKQAYNQLLASLTDIILPPKDGNLENNTVQQQAFWQNAKLNELRSNLYISALKLHEAWLAEVLRNGTFGGNLVAISHLLANKRIVNESHSLYIWQSLFMWVPVISSTFASINRQFKNIGRQQLGWLLIDEAGQAVPQAAVGALWRAQKTLVVGDPLQIEPVFTVPPNLVEGLAQYSLRQNNHIKWLPTLASIQTLADDANKLGAHIRITFQEQWIGCPLRVHRRCLDPMFSVANSIAYNNKMINMRSEGNSASHYFLGDSCWYNIVGEATDKQYVKAQGELLLSLFAQICLLEKQLPQQLYIITPFKRIKLSLQKLIENPNTWLQYNLGSSLALSDSAKLKSWCAQHIGTVHTFQGKETHTVIFILGADQKNEGSVNWACGKPNLLNVALTRARDRFYVIGDYQLWSRKKYFSKLASVLPVIENLNFSN